MWGVKSVVGWDRKDRDGVGAASGLAGEREGELVYGVAGEEGGVCMCVCVGSWAEGEVGEWGDGVEERGKSSGVGGVGDTGGVWKGGGSESDGCGAGGKWMCVSA